MRLVLAATGASGAIYLQRLLDHLEGAGHEIHLLLSPYARVVIRQELGELRIPAGVVTQSERSMNAPYASGSSIFDAMAIVPCSMGTVGRIASGSSENAILRAADVFLKERRKLVLVPRETPLNLIHLRNLTTLWEAGAIILPAMPSFYTRPGSVEELADTVVWRVLDQLGIPSRVAKRWGESVGEAPPEE